MKDTLLTYGLSDKEAEIYIVALKLGEVTANKISNKTGFSRSTTYDILESLKRKGLINSIKKDKKYFFIASNPEILITRLKEKEELINEIIPELKQLQEFSSEHPLTTIYKGKTGLRTAANEMLDTKEILVYGGSIIAEDIFGTYTENFARKRVEKRIILRTIIGKTIPRHMKDPKVKKYTPIRTLNIFENHKTVYFIYNNNVLIWNLDEELTAIKIESKIFAESQKQLFNFLWSKAKS